MEIADRTPDAVGTRAARAEAHPYRWVDVWHWPLRLMHWLAAVAIVVLFVTGLYIGRPFFMSGGEASSHFIMGRMRFFHFAAAGLLVATGIVRIYLLFAGNRYERLKALFPIRAKDWRNTWRKLRNYALVRPESGPHFIGHNPLSQLSYTTLYVVTIVMVVTGFALYGQANPGGFFDTTFGWVRPLFGGAQIVRFWHHVLAWFFAIFFPIHFYFSLRSDVTEREGLVSSMISGGKYIRDDLDYEDD
ncbi:MAG: Ni/Fe-hydrogenase, b-type cytochrome subunit [Gemmatimonadota bacterium]|nr:Ni/Fe-hydrogenase, b-type cytochrome subunit [Gemmatimonadota bacterium]